MNEIEQLTVKIKKLEEIVDSLIAPDRLTLDRLLQFKDGRNVQLGKGTGTKIGTETTQKLAFFGATPIVRQATISTPSSASGTYSQSQVQSIVNAVVELNTLMTNFGLTS